MKKLLSRVFIVLLALCVFTARATPALFVTSSPASAYYKAGQMTPITVTFPEVVIVTGTPLLALDDGGTAQYSSGSGTLTLTFLYTVRSGDTSALLDYISTTALTLNGGTIDTVLGAPVSLTLPAPGAAGSLSANAAIVIDTTSPTVAISSPNVSYVNSSTPIRYNVTWSDANMNSSSISLNALEVFENTTFTGSASLNSITVSARTGNTVPITFGGLSGGGTVFFSIPAGTASDLAGNLADASAPSAAVVVDNTPPTVTISAPSVASTAPGGSVGYTVSYSDANFASATLTAADITLTDLAVTGTVGVTKNNAMTYTVTISGLAGNGSQAIQIAAGTASDLAGNSAPAAGPSSSFTVSSAAGRFAISMPASVTAGSGFAGTVTALNSLGNTATGYSGTIHFTSTDGSAVLPADSTLINGVGTFSFTLKTAGNQTVTATDTATSSITGTSGDVLASPAPATHFAVALPASSVAGTAFSGTVTALDQFGNIASGFAATVHFTSSDGAAVLPADSTLVAGSGTFSFTLETAGAQTVSASATGDPPVTGTSGNVNVISLGAAQFAVAMPASAIAGAAFTGTVTALDSASGIASGYTGTVHFTSSDGAAILPGDAMLTNGVGTFSFTLKTPGSQTVMATDTVNAMLAGVSSAITVIAPPPSLELYVSDTGNNTVSKVSSTGTVSPFIISGLNAPEGLAFDSVGNLYVANSGSGAVSKVTPGGLASTFASGFQSPAGLAFDNAGYLYVANGGGGAISKVDSSGVVTTLASAGLTTPVALAIDVASNIYVTDLGAGAVFKVAPSGSVSGFVTGLSYPAGLVIGPGGNLFVARNSGNAISEITPGGVVSPFVTAGLRSPYGLAFDGQNNLYVANEANGTISLVSAAGNVVSLAGGFIRPQFVAVAPVVAATSINRASASPANVASVSWTAVFNGTVSNLTSDNFVLVNTGLQGEPAITSVSPLGSAPSATWTVTAIAGSGSGTLGLDLVNGDGLALPVTDLPFAGQVYIIDTISPSVTISPPSAAMTTGGPVRYTVTFSDANLGGSSLLFTSVQVSQTGAATIAHVAVAPGAGTATTTNYIVTLSGLLGNGMIGITIPAGAAFDLAGNQSAAAASATFMQVDNPPVLAPIANYTINEAALLIVTNSAADNNFPPLPLTFSLGAGAPANAAIDPVTGIFHWRPAAAQAPGTNIISVIVTDNGTPPLSATQQFTVVVLPVPSQFALSFGDTNLLVGETNFVPITLASQLALTNITAVLQAPTNSLTNLALSAVSPEVVAALLQALGGGQYRLDFILNLPANPNGPRVLANLDFASVPQVHSAIVPLIVSQPSAQQVDGTASAQATAANGQVIIVGLEPVLIASLGTDLTRILTIYGNPGSNYELGFSTNVSSANWQSAGTVLLTNGQQNINVDQTPPQVFYRAQ